VHEKKIYTHHRRRTSANTYVHALVACTWPPCCERCVCEASPPLCSRTSDLSLCPLEKFHRCVVPSLAPVSSRRPAASRHMALRDASSTYRGTCAAHAAASAAPSQLRRAGSHFAKAHLISLHACNAPCLVMLHRRVGLRDAADAMRPGELEDQLPGVHAPHVDLHRRRALLTVHMS
jgi:hypothetical protein